MQYQYGAQIPQKYPETSWNPTQSKILKTILGHQWFLSNHTIHDTTKSCTIQEYIKNASEKFKLQIINSPFDHI